jgi:hypothetical protein
MAMKQVRIAGTAGRQRHCFGSGFQLRMSVMSAAVDSSTKRS